MTDSTPIVNIVGDQITLGPLSTEELPLITRWKNDLGAQVRVGRPIPGPMTFENEESWYADLNKPGFGIQFLIRERTSGTPVGSCGLHGINPRNRSSTFGILIGDPGARGKGYGTEATRMVLDYGFTLLGLHSISLSVAEFNVAGQRAYARAGYREVGRLREALYFAGRMWDEVFMDCLSSEFESPYIVKQILPDSAPGAR